MNITINPLAFMISFSIGIFAILLKDPLPRVVVSYPTPHNLSNIYKNKENNCYQYEMIKTQCEN